MIITSFEPVINSTSTVLILGSMPGVESLRRGQYYAHRRNLFWRIMGDLVGVDPADDYQERILQLQRAGIALWDSLMHCERPESSLDTKIIPDTEVANDMASLLEINPSIRTICFNGKKSEQVFRKQVIRTIPPSVLDRLVFIGLPSTSPANSAITYERKLARWSIILDYLPHNSRVRL